MKKLFVLTSIFALVLASCSEAENADTAEVDTGEIGKTGPGGGKVFFAQGGQYKECSGELGAYPWADAVNAAKNHQGGGFTDWRLPDRGELDLLYQNRTIVGGFLSVEYWSSAEYSSGSAWGRSFYNNSEFYNGKTSSYRVRAVRAFSL